MKDFKFRKTFQNLFYFSDNNSLKRKIRFSSAKTFESFLDDLPKLIIVRFKWTFYDMPSSPAARSCRFIFLNRCFAVLKRPKKLKSFS